MLDSTDNSRKGPQSGPSVWTGPQALMRQTDNTLSKGFGMSKAIIGVLLKAAAKGAERGVLQGINVEQIGDSLILTSTDGHFLLSGVYTGEKAKNILEYLEGNLYNNGAGVWFAKRAASRESQDREYPNYRVCLPEQIDKNYLRATLEREHPEFPKPDNDGATIFDGSKITIVSKWFAVNGERKCEGFYPQFSCNSVISEHMEMRGNFIGLIMPLRYDEKLNNDSTLKYRLKQIKAGVDIFNAPPMSEQ